MHQGDFQSSHSSIVEAVEDEGSYSSTRRLRSAVCVKIFECTEHSVDRNASSAVPGQWPHTTPRSIHLVQEYSWKVFYHHPPYSPDLAPSDFHLFLLLKKFLSAFSEWQRGGYDCHSGSNLRRQTSAMQDTKVGPTVWQKSKFQRWIFENISTLAVSVPINLSIKLGFVSVNGPREI